MWSENTVPNSIPESVAGGVLSCSGDVFLSIIFIYFFKDFIDFANAKIFDSYATFGDMSAQIEYHHSLSRHITTSLPYK